MEQDNVINSYMLTNMVFDTAIRGGDGIITGWDANEGAALIDAYVASQVDARVQLLAKALREIYSDGLENHLVPAVEGGELWCVRQTDASKIAETALREAGLDKESE